MKLPEVVESVKTIESANLHVNEDIKLSFREKIACVIGIGPATFHYQMIQTYLLFFYSDVMNISLGFIAALFLVVRIIVAVLSPIIGALIDKINTPWGKYKPWFVILGIPLGITGWLTFTDFNLGSTGSLVYATVTYTLYSVLAAIITVPSGAIQPTITKRVDDRVSIGQFSFLFTVLGALLVGVAALPLYKALGGGNDARGFSFLMAIVAIITILIALYQAFTLKERYIVKKNKDAKAPSFKEMIGATLKNRTAVIVYIYIFGMSLGTGVRTAVSLHFFKYYFEQESLLAIMGLLGLLPTLIGVAMSGKLTKRFGIKKVILASVITNIVGAPILLLIPSNSTGLIIYIVVSVLLTLISGISSPPQAAMMPAAIDYTEWKSGLNLNAFMNSLSGFAQTLATALSGSIAAASLALIGYIPNVDQSSTTLFGLKILMFVLPAIFISLQLCILWFDLTEEKQAQIAKDLEVRRNSVEA